MAKIYRMKDRKKIKFDDVTISFAPLSNQEKSELATKAATSSDVGQILELSMETLRKSVKHVEGIEYGDGESFKLEFDESGLVSEECMNELMTLSVSTEMLAISMTLISNFGANDFINPETKLPFEGVSVLGNENKAGSKKKK